MYSYARSKTAAGDESLQDRFQRVMTEWLVEFGAEVEKSLKTRNMVNLMRYAEVAEVQTVKAREMGQKIQVSFDGEVQRWKDPNSNKARFIGYVVAEVKPTNVNTIPYKVSVRVVGGGESSFDGNLSGGPSSEAYHVTGDVADGLGKALPDFWQHLQP